MAARVVWPAAAGTSKTSNTLPVGRITLASGFCSHQRVSSAVSVVAIICQAGDSGWAPGSGQPTRSHEHARRPSRSGWAPRQLAHPSSAYSSTEAIVCAFVWERPRLFARRAVSGTPTIVFLPHPAFPR